MEYCELHKDVSKEKSEHGYKCPLCECLALKSKALLNAVEVCRKKETENAALRERWERAKPILEAVNLWGFNRDSFIWSCFGLDNRKQPSVLRKEATILLSAPDSDEWVVLRRTNLERGIEAINKCNNDSCDGRCLECFIFKNAIIQISGLAASPGREPPP